MKTWWFLKWGNRDLCEILVYGFSTNKFNPEILEFNCIEKKVYKETLFIDCTSINYDIKYSANFSLICIKNHISLLVITVNQQFHLIIQTA